MSDPLYEWVLASKFRKIKDRSDRLTYEEYHNLTPMES